MSFLKVVTPLAGPGICFVTPWRLYQNYALDIVSLRLGRVNDGVMQYS